MRLARPALLVAVVTLLQGCALFPSVGAARALTAAVAAVPVPEGWAELGSVEVACPTVNLDCQDTSARRIFRTDDDATSACGELVGYLANTEAFVDATGTSGVSSAPPSADDCEAELTDRQRYLVTAPGPGGTGQWKLRLRPVSDGYELSVGLGDPPRVPWD